MSNIEDAVVNLIHKQGDIAGAIAQEREEAIKGYEEGVYSFDEAASKVFDCILRDREARKPLTDLLNAVSEFQESLKGVKENEE
jgi:hypothetical protein